MKFCAQLLLLIFFIARVTIADEPKVSAKSQPALLQQFGIEYKTAGAEIFNKAVDASALEKGVGHFIKDAVDRCRAEAVKQGKSINSIAGMAGQWLELALLVALKHKGFTPAYFQFELPNVPDAVMDVAVFSETRGPIVMSCKTSLRERYKQAEQEAISTRKTFPNSYSCVVTLDADKRHIARVRKKIEAKEILALEAIYDETNLDKLFELLSKEKLIRPNDTMLKRARLVVK